RDDALQLGRTEQSGVKQMGQKSGVVLFGIDIGEQVHIIALLPAKARPEAATWLVVHEDHQMGLQDTVSFQALQGTTYQCSANAPIAQRLKHQQMLEIATLAIMAGHDSSDDPAVLDRNEAEPGVARQITRDTLPRVRIA